MSTLADAGYALQIQARGGFQYGTDPVDNPTTDPTLIGSFTSAATTMIVAKMLAA